MPERLRSLRPLTPPPDRNLFQIFAGLPSKMAGVEDEVLAKHPQEHPAHVYLHMGDFAHQELRTLPKKHKN